MSSTLQVNVQLNGPQFKLHQVIATRRTVFGGFGRGLGKSWQGRFECLLKVAEYDGKPRPGYPKLRGVRIVPLMPTLTQFKDVHWDSLEAELTGNGDFAFLRAKLDKQRGQIKFPGGSWIKPFPARAYTAQTGRGIRCDIIWPDEVDDIEPDVYDAVSIPWLSEPWSLGIELPFGTPRRGRHGLWYRMHQAGKLGQGLRTGSILPATALQQPAALAIRSIIEQLKGEDWPEILPRDHDEAVLWVLKSQYAFHATYKDAPETVSPLAVIRARQSMTAATFEREWEANPDAGEGLVYPFDEGIHVKEPHPDIQFSEYLLCKDHGFSDPGVWTLLGLYGAGDEVTVWVLNEVYQPGQTEPWWADEARTFEHSSAGPDDKWTVYGLRRNPIVFADPSRADVVKLLRDKGHTVGRTDNSILPGVATVASFIVPRPAEGGTRRPRFYVRPCCVNTIREFGMYRRQPDPLNASGFREMPLDRDNHCIARGTLIQTDHGLVPIERVTVGELVQTRAGLRRVRFSGQTGTDRQLWRVTAGNLAVEATPEHQVWTENRGWVRIDAVTIGDIMLGEGNAPVPVQSSALAGRSDVFDLKVDGDPEFFAGGLLVHNCPDAIRYGLVGRFGFYENGRYVVPGS